MAKRDTVNVDCNKIDILRKANEWNQSAFSRKVGKYSSWYSEVLRGNNLPSPEEAALMCQLLNTTPEEILMQEGKDEKETAKCQEDIKRVRELLEQPEQKESAPDPKTEGARPQVKALFDFIDTATDQELDELIRYAQYLTSKR